MDKLAPVILFVYNRPGHMRLTVEHLKENKFADSSELFIFSDGAKSESDARKVIEVRDYLKTIKGFKSVQVIERERNFGLANSIIKGINEVFKFHKQVIVLEDDMISSPFFLKYMNDLLKFYEADLRIQSVTGYTFPIKIPESYEYDLYLSPRASSWGWGTWKNRWADVDWDFKDYNNFIKNKTLVHNFNKGGEDLTRMLKNQKEGKIDSWSIIWSYAHFKNNTYCIYPIKSRIKNIGTDLSGVHTKKTKKYDVELDVSDAKVDLVSNIQPDDQVLRNFKNFFKKNFLSSTFHKIKRT